MESVPLAVMRWTTVIVWDFTALNPELEDSRDITFTLGMTQTSVVSYKCQHEY